MNQLADELRRAILIRSDALEEKIGRYRGRLGDTRMPLAGVLDIFAEFPRLLNHVVEQEWQHNEDPDSRVEILRALLLHQTEVTSFVDTWLSRDTQPEVPQYLLGAIRRTCIDLGLGPCEPVLLAGSANNYFTFLEDIRVYLFKKLGYYCPPLPDDLVTTKFVIVVVPQFEGFSVLWAPILLGHEMAHLAALKNSALEALNLETMFDNAKAREVIVPGVHTQGTEHAAMTLYNIAERWAVELLCDAYALRAYGIGAVAAMSEYLEVIGATDNLNLTHPPGRLRVELMLSWLPEHPTHFDQILDPWRTLDASDPNTLYPDWSLYLCELFRACADRIHNEANRWDGSSYDAISRSDIIREIASDLADGIPNDLTYLNEGTGCKVAEADVISAAWLARVEGYETPFLQLAQKGLELREFVRHWEDAGGQWQDATEASSIGTSSSEQSVLSAAQIQERMQATGPERLVIRPYMYGSADGVSVDIRLGNQFIVFIRSKTPSFDPLISGRYPRSMQRLLQLSWDEKFVLHPHELVLAATLEYFAVPTDLTAQVVTRSSYGRLGLISATAVQVHPGFHGSLTLELVNLGTVPLELKPGARIAQLVFSKTAETPLPDAKYHCTVGPQFSRVHADSETEILRKLARSGG